MFLRHDGKRQQPKAALSDHKISKYIDYPNMKELFLILQPEKEIPFGNGESSLFNKRRQEQTAYSEVSQAAAEKITANAIPAGNPKDIIIC